jgi:transcriptional regulator with XRE-family HTH domain
MSLKREEVSKKIGARIREIRNDKGLSIEKVANGANIDYTQLSRIELGKISKSLDVPIPHIFHVLDQDR